MFFGVHCLLLGALALRSGFAPRWLGWLLAAAGAAYLLDSFARTLVAGYAATQAVWTLVVFVPAFVAELSFTIWLLARAPRVLRHARIQEVA